MAAQTVDLISERLLGDFKVLRLPPRPALPEIAAAPSRHNENSLAVGEVEKFLGLEFAFEAHGVESHILDVAEFVFEALRVFAKHHVGRPAAAADQDVLAVDVEGTSADRVQIGSDFADAEVGFSSITDFTVDVKFHGQRIKIRFAHLCRPPQARTGEDELRKLVGYEGDVFRFVGGEFDFLLKFDTLDLAFEFAFDGLAGGVL